MLIRRHLSIKRKSARLLLSYYSILLTIPIFINTLFLLYIGGRGIEAFLVIDIRVSSLGILISSKLSKLLVINSSRGVLSSSSSSYYNVLSYSIGNNSSIFVRL